MFNLVSYLHFALVYCLYIVSHSSGVDLDRFIRGYNVDEDRLETHLRLIQYFERHTVNEILRFQSKNFDF